MGGFLDIVIKGIAAEALRSQLKPRRSRRMETPSHVPNVPVPAVDIPTPWYKSKTQLLQVVQTCIGIGLAVGVISPQLGTALSGNIEPIIGGVIALIGAAALLTHPTEVKTTAVQAAEEAAVGVAEAINGNSGAAAVPPLRHI